eukprot:336437-Pleurochrysis_carterae.AAC.1
MPSVERGRGGHEQALGGADCFVADAGDLTERCHERRARAGCGRGDWCWGGGELSLWIRRRDGGQNRWQFGREQLAKDMHPAVALLR